MITLIEAIDNIEHLEGRNVQLLHLKGQIEEEDVIRKKLIFSMLEHMIHLNKILIKLNDDIRLFHIFGQQEVVMSSVPPVITELETEYDNVNELFWYYFKSQQ